MPSAVRPAAAFGVAAGATAMVCVGGSVAVSSVLAGAPVFTAEAVRYGGACLILVALAHLTGRRLSRPRGAEWLWLWLSGIAAFVLWYSSVRRLGASRAGLPTGIAPVAAAATGVLLGGAAPRPLVWAGIAVVAAGLAFGFRSERQPSYASVVSGSDPPRVSRACSASCVGFGWPARPR